MYSVTRQYTLAEYIRPIWVGDVTAHESVLFKEDDHAVRLAYPADEILAVLSSDLQTEYEEGRDWALEYGCLVRLPGSRIPALPLDWFYPAEHRDGCDFASDVPGKPWLGFGEGDTMIRWQLAVTYRHSAPWGGPVPDDQAAKLSRFHDKLSRGEEATILFYGDSITTGSNSSGPVGVAPHAPSFPRMVTSAAAEKYGYTVSWDVNPYEEMQVPEKKGGKILHYVNTAVGGMDSRWGVSHVDTHVNDYKPDLIILAFGMNDSRKTKDEYMDLTRQMVESMQKAVPDADIILLSTMLPHWRARGFFGHQIEYEPALVSYAASQAHVAAAPMTSLHKYLLSRKEYYTMSGNNVNHPVDFLARMYAMVLLKTMGI